MIVQAVLSMISLLWLLDKVGCLANATVLAVLSMISLQSCQWSHGCGCPVNDLSHCCGCPVNVLTVVAVLSNILLLWLFCQRSHCCNCGCLVNDLTVAAGLSNISLLWRSCQRPVSLLLLFCQWCHCCGCPVNDHTVVAILSMISLL